MPDRYYKPIKFNDNFQALNYQLCGAQGMLERALNNENVIFEAPPGIGKTEIAMLAMCAYQNRNPNSKTLIVTPSILIGDQWLDRMKKYGIDEKLNVHLNKPASRGYAPFYRAGRGRRSHIPKNLLLQSEKESKRNMLENSDVFISTFNLLKSDIERERFSKSATTNYELMVIDEIEPLVALPEEDPRFSLFYRPVLETFNHAKKIVLTALPSKKSEIAEIELPASRIRPLNESFEKYMPRIHTQYINIEDPIVVDIVTSHNHESHYIAQNALTALRADADTKKILGKHLDVKPVDLLSYIRLHNIHRSLVLSDPHEDRDNITKAKYQIAYLMKRVHTSHRVLESTAASLAGEDIKISDISRECLTKRIEEGGDLNKTTCLLELLESMKGKNVSPLIFVNYRPSADALEELLKEEGYPTFKITGDVEAGTRYNEIERFNNGNFVMILTYRAGGFGVDLPQATHIIFYGVPMTISGRNQALGRGMRSKDIRKAGSKELEEVMLFYDYHPERSLVEYHKGRNLVYSGEEATYPDSDLDDIKLGDCV